MCGIGPIAFIATSQSLTGVPQSLSSSGRFDFHVKLVVPAAAEHSAILKYEIRKTSLQCSDDFPSQRERLDILAVLSRKLPMVGDVSLEADMTEGFSGAGLQALLSHTQLEAVHKLLDSQGAGRLPVITNALLKSVASKAKPSVADSEKQRLYDIYSQFLDAKRSVAARISLLFPLHSCTHVTQSNTLNKC